MPSNHPCRSSTPCAVAACWSPPPSVTGAGASASAPEDLGLDPAHVSDRLIQLGHKRLIPRDALQTFALIESRVQATVEGSSFPFLGGIGRFVPNPRLSELTDRLDKLRDEFQEAALDFVAGYSPLRDNATREWREAAQHLNGSAERLILTIEQSFPPSGDIAKRFAFEPRLFQIAAPDRIRLEVAEGLAEFEVADDRRRIADNATRRMQSDLDTFIRESVTSLREETARIVTDVLATIDGSENGVHQRTLNRLTTFIDIIIARHKRRPTNFDTVVLARACEQFTGAEIEAVFVDAMHEAYAEGEEPNRKHLLEAITRTVPVANLMDGRIASLRHWAKGRAREAAARVTPPRGGRRMADAN